MGHRVAVHPVDGRVLVADGRERRGILVDGRDGRDPPPQVGREQTVPGADVERGACAVWHGGQDQPVVWVGQALHDQAIGEQVGDGSDGARGGGIGLGQQCAGSFGPLLAEPAKRVSISGRQGMLLPWRR